MNFVVFATVLVALVAAVAAHHGTAVCYYSAAGPSSIIVELSDTNTTAQTTALTNGACAFVEDGPIGSNVQINVTAAGASVATATASLALTDRVFVFGKTGPADTTVDVDVLSGAPDSSGFKMYTVNYGVTAGVVASSAGSRDGTVAYGSAIAATLSGTAAKISFTWEAVNGTSSIPAFEITGAQLNALKGKAYYAAITADSTGKLSVVMTDNHGEAATKPSTSAAFTAIPSVAATFVVATIAAIAALL
ncbi:uncharacterized protein AMSG_06581 [Thecamonas trahens ATCC 50062]|uniref:DOMON domain-containing protein n=1 Tax=Thecamonas trahens ATCC 50062 TaxID=461836 RepID=A0A0L0DIS7_THETB|nr:hypothetical protein AMSG_06581 [Thecamonas trahens ATCC 50062]KNC51223.1 hypothetical protein AMSG_06581 [Thecamonas trahens ATCC 50062]|eukprot:XP_013756420.1 hypothetical protein AMSG_06581 [Thecamonas trahens ATCC 50062]